MEPTNLNKGLFSRKDWEAYLKGDKKLQGNLSDAGKEALEGLTTGQFSAAELHRLENQLWKKSFYQRHEGLIKFMVPLILGVILGGGVFVLLSPIERMEEIAPLNLDHTDESTAVPPIERSRDAVIVTEPLSIKVQIEGSVEKKTVFEEKVPEPSFSQLPIKGIQMISPVGKPKEVKLKFSTIQVPLFYVGQYKWVDYEKLFPEQYRENRLSGTEALFENKYPIREESNYYPMTKPSYKAKVAWAISYLEKGKYPQALKEMRHLLNAMPEDVNLNFYTGILEFQLGEFELALKHFELTKTIYPPLFNQEAAWYQALCLKELRRKEEAKQRLVEIQDMEGFYSQDAAKELEELDAK
jgi:hypothetical protein